MGSHHKIREFEDLFCRGAWVVILLGLRNNPWHWFQALWQNKALYLNPKILSMAFFSVSVCIFVLVLLYAVVDWFSVSRLRDLFYLINISEKICLWLNTQKAFFPSCIQEIRACFILFKTVFEFFGVKSCLFIFWLFYNSLSSGSICLKLSGHTWSNQTF